jgi:mannose-1-phosphate guanylyltransferase
MKAMILTAGLGTRLLPLTLERAKPAIPLLGKPVLVRLLSTLMDQGIDRFRLNLHHLPDSIEGIFQSKRFAHFPVSFSHEPKILGTAGGLKANESFFADETFVMVNGKIVLEIPLSEALDFHRKSGALATLILRPQKPPYRHYPVRIDHQGFLRDFKGVGPGRDLRKQAYTFTGVHIIEPDIFDFIPKGEFHDINSEAYTRAMKSGRKVCGFPADTYWNEVSTPERYLSTVRDLLEFTGEAQPSYVSPEAHVSAGAHVGSYVSAEAGCILDADSRVENSILWENVRLKPRASVSNCIVGSDMTIEGSWVNTIITRSGDRAIDAE